ncbi:BlaI/MecI/CopY family transcriptional regulator [bacterium]|jgi:BlaI family transcriptional regulator, penicillinase repressor|nr:BlaI/MecI/CopY family transcriptional regulator [Verrucomicrobiota bacterium]MDA7645580.1 BlaI/MecI/CopY family transcriptional regulator [bacterium]MDA7680281.1 BlaI/MecI/CopY family transcriptional regulator [bacterium]
MKPDQSGPRKLGDLQLKIMKILWTRKRATVGDVLNDLEGAKPLAYTTVATMLRKMEARGLVRHFNEGRTFIYEAAFEEASVSRSLADDLVERLFEGRLSSLVSHFLSTRDVSEEELERLESLVRETKQAKRNQ